MSTQITPCDAGSVCHAFFDDACLCLGLVRVCVNVYFETHVAMDLFIDDLTVFGWSKKPSLLMLSQN